MKKLTILLIISFLFVSTLLLSSDIDKFEQEKLIQQRNSVNAEHIGSFSIPSRDAGDILFQFNPPIAPWGVGYDGEFLWLSVYGDSNIYQYATDGTATGTTIDCSSWMGSWVGDMAYTTGYIFAVNVGGDNNIYKLDEVTGDVIEFIAGAWNYTSARGLAYDPDANEFYIGGWNHSEIYHIDATGATISTIPFAGVSGLAWHPMGNNGAGTLFVTESTTSNNIYEIDPTNGTIIQQFTSPGGTYACAGLAIDSMGNLWAIDQNTNTVYNIDSGVPMGEPGAPAAPTDFVIVPDPGGALSADLSWVCPTLTIDGSTLTDLDEMLLYRGEDLIYTDTNPTIGGAGSYTDFVPASGNYSYSVLGVNSQGPGIPATIASWIGEDVPNVLENLLLVQTAPGVLSGTLTWDNPTTGLNGGAFNEPILGYHIVRYPDIVTYESTGIATEYIDNTITVAGNYFYTVQAYNSIGDGGIAVSNAVLIADENLLILEDFSTWLPADWTATSTSGQVNWVQGTGNVAGGTAPEAQFNWSPSTVATQRLTSPILDTSGATALALEFRHSVNDYNGDYFLYIQTTSDGTTWNDIMTIPSEVIPATLVQETVVNSDVGSATFQIAWVFDGDSYNINQWYVDDIMLSMLEHGNVEGVITDDATTDPIEGVDVYIGPFGPATTNVLGEYLLEGIVTGPQEVTAFKDGYYDFVGEVVVLEDQTVTYDFVMVPNLYGTLDGTVTDAVSGDPLVGAEINAISLGGYEYDAVTDNDGYYEIIDVVAETYDVTCAFPDYPTGMVEDVIIEDGMTTTVDFSLEGYTFWNDFETNDGGLVSSDLWDWGAFTSGPMSGYSGTNGWATSIAGNYPNGANSTLDTPMSYLIGSPSAMLEFWHWYDIENGYDGGNVKISTDGGSSWSVIVPLTGYSGVANTSNPLSGEEIFCGHDQMFWELAQFDLSGYVGQSVMFRWHFGSDSSVQYPGWYIDDVAISGGGAPVDPGYIEGTVEIAEGAGNVEDVEVEADGVIVNPLADGTYSIELQPGTYDVTATLDGYDTEVIEDVLVTEGNVTTGVDFSLVTDGDEIIIAATKLDNNYPNPFNPETIINYSIKEAGDVTIEVYNIKGQLVKILVNEVRETGNYTVIWNGKDNSNKFVASGVYFYKMKSGNYTATKKMILMK